MGLQRESTKVVLMSNCSNSQGRLGRLPMEDQHDGLPKYKQRSVSAVRDFPPGCGRHHPPRISFEPKDKAVCITIVENLGDSVRNGHAEGDGLFSSRSGIDSQPPKALETLDPAIVPGAGDMNQAESNIEAHLIPSQNGIESQPAKALENTSSTVISRQSDHLESKLEAPVDPSELENGNPVNIEPADVSFPGVPDSLSNAAGDIEELKSLEHETDHLPNILHKNDVASSRDHIFPQKKYPPRRKVSAARDFPPFCGRNAATLVHGNTNVLASADGEIPKRHMERPDCVTRSKVKETLRLFHAIYRKTVKAGERKSKNTKRPDFVAANILKDKGKYINLSKIIGPVPGVEVGDEFQFRVELHIIGLHRPMQGGIDFVKDKGGRLIATSIVASGGYDDNMDHSDVLIYTGSGGNLMNGKKEPEDQKLERGNLGLKNSADVKNPVRVIRGDMRVSQSSSAKTRIYVYDGLYTVEKCWQDLGPHSKRIFKFKLVRLPGQPELACKGGTSNG